MQCSGATEVGTEGLAETAFRIAEKKYKLYRVDRRTAKRVRPPPDTDFSDVVDFTNWDKNTTENKRAMRFLDDNKQMLEFVSVPGLFFFPQAIPVDLQATWATTALTQFATSPPYPNNRTTLDPGACTNGYEPGMRWATLGFNYNWTEKSYDAELFSPFPALVKQFVEPLVGKLRDVLLSNRAATASEKEALHRVFDGYEPQTAIVNYFPVGSMMMAHQDVSEVCLERPLVSCSVGCSVVFLMGTDKREDKPHAFLIRSGDVVVFTGPSRVAFHAVPRILEDCPASLLPVEEGEERWREVMATLRINVNIRQVYEKSFPKLFIEK